MIKKLIAGGEVQVVLDVDVASPLDPYLSNVIAVTGLLMLRNNVFPLVKTSFLFANLASNPQYSVRKDQEQMNPYHAQNMTLEIPSYII